MTMSNYPKQSVPCKCGSNILISGLKQHYQTKKHQDWEHAHPTEAQNIPQPVGKVTKFTQRIPGKLPNLNTTLRYTSSELRSNPRVRAIQFVRNDVDPYTKQGLSFQNGHLTRAYDVDHIHEVQVLIYTINHIPALSPRAVERLRDEINDISNLVITDRSINRSKGQAIKYFLNHLNTKNQFSLLFALVQTSSGDKRQIAPYSGYIANVINDTKESMSNRIREIRRNDGHVTGSSEYNLVADQFDSVIDQMRLDSTDGIRLRSGRIYHPPRK